MEITDQNVDSLIFNDDIFERYLRKRNIFFRQYDYNPFNNHDFAWLQTSSVVSHIRNIVNKDNRIFNANPYKDRYNNNDDLIVHVRLGDIIEFGYNLPYHYYENTISSLNFNKGYIISDSPDNDFVKRLIERFNLVIYNSDEIDTLQFASTCRKIVLSQGTYSWLTGLLGFYSQVYYPKNKIKWHGNIYIYPDWNERDY